MLYECDSNNCNAGAANCSNRAFAKLQERHKAGGKYRVGVDVIKTDDRGYGIRSNRTFEPNQIIMEYTGEIITEEECDRRMREKYKDNKVCLVRQEYGRVWFAGLVGDHVTNNIPKVLLPHVIRPEHDH